jgi:hypothetical protein
MGMPSRGDSQPRGLSPLKNMALNSLIEAVSPNEHATNTIRSHSLNIVLGLR